MPKAGGCEDSRLVAAGAAFLMAGELPSAASEALPISKQASKRHVGAGGVLTTSSIVGHRKVGKKNNGPKPLDTTEGALITPEDSSCQLQNGEMGRSE